jgi:hypothetical protein
MPHLCFYSEKCKFSQSFLSELKGTPYMSEFKLICVDRDPRTNQLPSIVSKGIADKWLTAVPTLVIDGETGPRTDAEVFNWLSMRKLQDGQKKGPNPTEQAGGEPSAYGPEIASGKWSDNYSFFDQSFDVAKGTGFDPIQKNFAQLQDFGSPALGNSTPGQTVVQQAQRSKKEVAMDKALEDFQKQRQMDTPLPFGRK